MALADRLRSMFRTRGTEGETHVGLPYSPGGVVWPGWPYPSTAGTVGDFWAWNRWNGFPGTSFSYGGGGMFGEGGYGSSCASRARRMSTAELYRTQPHLQTVVAFRARNVAQLPLHLYRIEDGVHEKQHGALADLFTRPNRHMTGYELIASLVQSLDLYGDAYWAVMPDETAESGWTIEPFSAELVTPVGGTIHKPDRYDVKSPVNGNYVRVPAENMVRFASFMPDGIGTVSPVGALKDVLAEQIAAWEYRRQAWSRQGRAGSFLYRPASAPVWSEKARETFTESWHEFQRNGARAGETPLLEDGMELRRVGFSAREDEWAEVSKLSLQTVCAVYHVAPAMLGMEGTASYASVREFRSMLYTETLGPIIRQIEQRINQFVLPLVAPDDPYLTLKFNIDAKLAGSFEEQAGVLSTSIGGPWMTVNEGRGLRNLPPVEGGDSLIVPLNVTQGGQASPQDGGKPSVAVENARAAIEASDDDEGELLE